MRPKKFGVKPLGFQKYRRTTRPTQFVSAFARALSGSEYDCAKQVGEFVVQQVPIDSNIKGIEKKRLFRAQAERSMAKKVAIGPFHCAERCNLAIALLNESGVKAWLARVVYPTEGSWRFHDYVEFANARGKVNTLIFIHSEGVPDSSLVLNFPVEKMFPQKTPYIYRGADSKQIGGVGNWKEFLKFSRSVGANPELQMKKNRARIELLVKEGIIPKEALNDLVK